jgi:mannose-6-phosphate isomerase-like protein (cupin superfamily)
MSSPILAPALAGNTIGNDFVIAEWQDAGGVSEKPRLIAPLHVHHRDDEAWYVLEGALCVRKGDEVIEVRAGAAVLVPSGIVHTYWNPGPGVARYLLIMSANIHKLIQAIHAMPDRNPAAVQEVFHRHDSEVFL